MNEEHKQNPDHIGQCSKFIDKGKGYVLETDFHNIRVKSSKNVYLNSFLTTFGLIDAMQYEDEDDLERYFNKFAKLTLTAKTEEDLQYINEFLNASTGLSNKVDDFIESLQDYIDRTGQNIIKLTDEQRTDLINEIDQKINKSRNSLSLQEFIDRKEKIDSLVAELDRKPMKDPQEYFDLVRDYEDLIFDLNQLEKQGKVKNKQLEQLIESVYKQCDSVKNTAEMIESIGERINQM